MSEISDVQLIGELQDGFECALSGTGNDLRSMVTFVHAVRPDIQMTVAREIDAVDATKYIVQNMAGGTVVRQCVWLAPNGGFNGYLMTVDGENIDDKGAYTHQQIEETLRTLGERIREGTLVPDISPEDFSRNPDFPRLQLETLYEEITALGEPQSVMRELDVVLGGLRPKPSDFDAFLHGLQQPGQQAS